MKREDPQKLGAKYFRWLRHFANKWVGRTTEKQAAEYAWKTIEKETQEERRAE